MQKNQDIKTCTYAPSMLGFMKNLVLNISGKAIILGKKNQGFTELNWSEKLLTTAAINIILFSTTNPYHTKMNKIILFLILFISMTSCNNV